MKKLLSTLTLAVLSCFTAVVYADSPFDKLSALSLNQVEFVDYIILAGIAIFLIGMILILIALYKKIKAKPDEAEYYEDESPENAEPSASLEDADTAEDEEDINDNSDDESSDEAETDTSEDEPETSDETDADEDNEDNGETEAAVAEAVEDAAVAEAVEDVEEPEVKFVRITFTGTNNPDVKIIEFEECATLGRKASNDLIISDKAVSGQHCKISADEDGTVYIEDLNSTNGTILNGETITKSEINNDDVLLVGKHEYKITILQ